MTKREWKETAFIIAFMAGLFLIYIIVTLAISLLSGDGWTLF
jgi:hypothetical protein